MTTTEQNIDQILIPILEQVSDPEIPVLSIMDMGVVRSAVIENNIVKVEITPTYSGCPAMDVIGDDIKAALKEAGYNSEIELILASSLDNRLDYTKRKKSIRRLWYCSTFRCRSR